MAPTFSSSPSPCGVATAHEEPANNGMQRTHSTAPEPSGRRLSPNKPVCLSAGIKLQSIPVTLQVSKTWHNDRITDFEGTETQSSMSGLNALKGVAPAAEPARPSRGRLHLAHFPSLPRPKPPWPSRVGPAHEGADPRCNRATVGLLRSQTTICVPISTTRSEGIRKYAAASSAAPASQMKSSSCQTGICERDVGRSTRRERKKDVEAGSIFRPRLRHSA